MSDCNYNDSLKYFVKDDKTLCLTAEEVNEKFDESYDILFDYNYSVRESNNKKIKVINVNFGEIFGTIKIKWFPELYYYLRDNNKFVLKNLVSEFKKSNKNAEQIYKKYITEECDIYRIIALDRNKKELPFNLNYNLREEVNNILNLDTKYRELDIYDNEEEPDLFTYDDIIFQPYGLESYDTNDVVILSHYAKSLPYYKILKYSNVKKNINIYLWKNFKITDEFNFKNIIFAGGTISSLVSQNYYDDLKDEDKESEDEERFIITNEIKHYHGLLHKKKIPDLDIFMYGIKTKEEATLKLKELINYFKPYGISIGKNCVTLSLDRGVTIDIVTRLYKSKSHILHAFDLGAAAIGWDGEDILLTSMSLFTYQFRTMIVDLNRRSTTFEKRLIKYWKRTKFDIIFPELNSKDFHPAPNENVETIQKDFKYIKLLLNYEKNIYDFEVDVGFTQNFNKYPLLIDIKERNYKFGITDDKIIKMKREYIDSDYKIAKTSIHNLKCLIKGELDNIYLRISKSDNDFRMDWDTFCNELKNSGPIQKERTINEFYSLIFNMSEFKKDKFFRRGMELNSSSNLSHIDSDYSSFLLNSKKLTIIHNLKIPADQSNILLLDIDMPPSSSIVTDLYTYLNNSERLTEFIRNLLYKDRDNLFNMEKYLKAILCNELDQTEISNKIVEDFANNINIIKKNLKVFNEKIINCKNISDIFNWNNKNPTTQLTSSVNPIIQDPIEWYGNYVFV